MAKKITIEVPDGKRAEWIDGVLKLVDEKDNRPVTERIKTFDDCLEELGEDHPLVKEYNSIRQADCIISSDIIAYLMLRIITAALNEGWEPQFTEGEWRYWPYFYLYTKEQYDNLDNDEKENVVPIKGSRVVARSYSNAYAYGGVAYVEANLDSSSTNTNIGSRLAFKSSELAKYAGKQFIDIFLPFIVIVKEDLGD